MLDIVVSGGLAVLPSGPEPADALPLYEAMNEEWVTKGASDELATGVASIIMSPGYDHSPWIAKWQARPRESMSEPFRTLAGRDDISDRLPEISAPAIVFHGEADVAIPMERAEQLLSELPNCAELVRIPGAGHASNLSHPGEVNGPLLAFLRRHRA